MEAARQKAYLKKSFTTIERQGRRENEQPKVGPKGEGVGTTESKSTEDTEVEVGQRLAGQAGAAFSNPSASELARDSENTSLTRSASGHASSLGTSYSLPVTAPEAPTPATSHPLPATAPKAQVFVLGIPPMAWLFAQLRGEVESGKVVLGVETHAMRRALEGLIRMPVVDLPHPVHKDQEKF